MYAIRSYYVADVSAQKIRIRMKAYDFKLLDQSVGEIVDASDPLLASIVATHPLAGTPYAVTLRELATEARAEANRLRDQGSSTRPGASDQEEPETVPGFAVVARITSYNVCYTKLLRGGP